MSNDDLKSHVETVHAYVRVLPSTLDLKVSIFATAITQALMFALRLYSDHHATATASKVGGCDSSDALLISGAVALCVAVAFSLVSLRARMHGSAGGLVSVVGLASRTEAELVAALRGATPDDLLDNEIRHSHELAGITMLKTRWFHRAAILGLLGIALVTAGVFVQR